MTGKVQQGAIMAYSSVVSDPTTHTSDTLVFFCYQADSPSAPALKKLNAASSGSLDSIWDSEEFTGALNTTAIVRKPAGWGAGNIVLAGLGERGSVALDDLRQAAGTVSRVKAVAGAKTLAFALQSKMDEKHAMAIVEGFELGSWKMLDYKTSESAEKARKRPPQKIALLAGNRADANKAAKGIKRGEIVAEAASNCRRLSYHPSNVLTAVELAKKAQKRGKECGFSVKVLNKNQIKKERMEALLAVNQGSTNEPRFIVMEYNGARAGQKPVVLVGKGVTFDTGGISIKPSANMGEMKADMTGSAVVISVMGAIAKLKLKLNVVGLVPATDNMPSGSAYKPGDVIGSRKGKTIEVINTDAEGRLLLADALDYANEFKPQAVIDIATLTGATIFSLGYAGAPILGTSKSILDQLRGSVKHTGEKVWELPLWPEYTKQMQSPIADLWNSGGRPAGTCTAAAFLKEFIGDYPWAHIDIAYVDTEYSGQPYVPKGPSGFGTRLLIETLSKWKTPK